MSRIMNDIQSDSRPNAFFADNENLYEKSMNANCEFINCLQGHINSLNNNELRYNINCGHAQNNMKIRNVDDEIPMLFPEYRFKHLNYCDTVNINGYTVCGKCNNCGFNKNIQLSPELINKMNAERCKELNN